MRSQDPMVVLIIGGTSDWAFKEILPGLFYLFSQGLLPIDTRILGVGRKVKDGNGGISVSREAYQKKIAERLEEVGGRPNQIQEFVENTFFFSGQVQKTESWRNISAFLNNQIMPRPHNVMVIMATSPKLVPQVLNAMNDADIIHSEDEIHRRNLLFLEKPFGTSHTECSNLFSLARALFGEDNIFPVDHYRGKFALLNFGVLRRLNIWIRAIYSSAYISRVTITAHENDTLDTRHDTYQDMKWGAASDMFMGHLLPLATWLALPEDAMAADARRGLVREHEMQLVSNMDVDPVYFGQYDAGSINHPRDGKTDVVAYRSFGDESYLSTPTYFAAQVHFRNGPLANVPIDIRTGKALQRKDTRIVFDLRGPDPSIKQQLRIILYREEGSQVHRNQILLPHLVRMPQLRFDAQVISNNICPSSDAEGANFTPYSKLLHGAMTGEWKDFPSSEVVTDLWRLCDPMFEKFRMDVEADIRLPAEERKVLKLYPAGINKPEYDFNERPYSC